MSKSSIGFGPSTLPELEAAQKVGSLDPRLSRTDYFDGRLLTATDLIRDQTYVDERVLEVGRALGSGVVRGLELSLSDDDRFLRVNPGMAITESGRVLEVTTDKALKIDLYDRALLRELNNGRYRRFNRGIYAVTLQYVEMGSDSAEAYPADPSEEREFQYDSFVEGAEITLTPLYYPLPSDNEIVSRSSLVKHFLRNPGQPRELSEQGVALGVLAMSNGRPQWLDTHLVRRPMRPEHVSAAWQMDLHRHYLELLDTVMLQRVSRSQDGEFAAAQYFHLLPPSGVLPMASVDPVKAAQYFFPENYEISISPVRYEDLAVIQNESMHLAPLDLDRGEAAEIMILAPMSNEDFKAHARRMGFEPEKEPKDTGVSVSLENKKPNYWLHATDLLQMRLTPEVAVPDKTITDIWTDIWKLIGQGDGLLHYVRRPARAAETQVSAVVLAHGFEIPDPSVDLEAIIKALTKERDEAKAKLDEVEDELEGYVTKVTNLKKQLSDAKEAHSTEVTELKGKIEKLNDQIALLKQQRQQAIKERNGYLKQLKKCQKDLEECRANGGGAGGPGGHDITACMRDPECALQLLKNRGLRDGELLNQAHEITLKIGESGEEPAKMLWGILGVIPPKYDQLLWPTVMAAMSTDRLPHLYKAISAGGQNMSAVGRAIADLAREIDLAPDVIDGWMGKGPLAPDQPVDAPVTDGVVALNAKTLNMILDLRGTTDQKIREQAALALKTIGSNKKELQSADRIIRNISGFFDSALWKSINIAASKDLLLTFEKYASLFPRDPRRGAQRVSGNARRFGLDSETASQWKVLAERYIA